MREPCNYYLHGLRGLGTHVVKTSLELQSADSQSTTASQTIDLIKVSIFPATITHSLVSPLITRVGTKGQYQTDWY